MGVFDAAMDGIVGIAMAKRAEEKGHENDYLGDDGLLMCATCHQPRQMVLEVPGRGTRIVPIMCACDIARQEAEKARKEVEEQQRRIRQLYKIGITSADYSSRTLEQDDGSNPAMRRLADKYIEERELMYHENIGLLLHGPTGGGKTFWGAAIGNAMIENARSAMITTTIQLVNAIEANFGENKVEVLGQVERVNFLILDDLGAERLPGATGDKVAKLMYEIIDTRYRSRRPLIVTTNLSMDDIKNEQDMQYKRIFDRIVEMCQPFHVSAEERRMAIAKKKGERAREILGL